MAVRWMADKNARSEALERGLTMFPALVNARSQRAGTLSGGEQQMLALACELATQPRVLVADELSLGLAPKIVDAVFDTLRHALKSGTSIILIEQFVDRALGLAENVIVLGGGLVVWQGPSDAVDTDELVRRYMGEVPLQLPE
jgi:branched-chain amino acid transport system ATP-binding protein